MLHDLHNLTGSLLKSLDILYVLERVKPCSRVLFDGSKELLTLLEKHKLSYAVSDFRIELVISQTGRFSDKGVKLTADTKKGELLLYISFDKKLAERAKFLESKDRYKELGSVLGYPECCCSFFERHFSETNLDLTKFTFSESHEHVFPFVNNSCLRVFDIGLISHFPCSFSCPETQKIAEKNFAVIQKYDMDIARYFAHALKSAVIYSEGVGVYSFKGVKLGTHSYGYAPAHLIASMKNDFYNLLMRRDRIRVVGKNRFFVGEILIEDPQTFFGVFS